MIINKGAFDLTDMLWANMRTKDYIELCKKVAEDLDKVIRIKNRECPRCYYGGKIGGAAITHISCGICGKKMVFGSTNVDTVCGDCAKKYKLCKHCGCDIKLRNRRKL